MKTMILDNNLENIKIYDSAGVDRIFYRSRDIR